MKVRAEQQALGQQITGFANKDLGDYMNRVMGVYQTGLQGLGGLNRMGFQASTGLAGNLANVLMNGTITLVNVQEFLWSSADIAAGLTALTVTANATNPTRVEFEIAGV